MQTEIITYPSDHDVEHAAEVLMRGGLVVFPTETVYGLGALISCPEAVKKIFEIKGRDQNKPLSVLVADSSQISRVAKLSIPERQEAGLSPAAGRAERQSFSLAKTVEKLAQAFWPGPLTIVLPKKEEVPREVTSGLDTIGVRIPDHPFALNLIRAVGRPVVTTSANLSGQAAAVSAQEAADALEGKVELIVDGGICPVKVASTVVGLDENGLTVFREGRLSEEQILQAAGLKKG